VRRRGGVEGGGEREGEYLDESLNDLLNAFVSVIAHGVYVNKRLKPLLETIL